MSKKRVGSLLFWGFFIGIFYLCSVNQKNSTNDSTSVKKIKKDAFKVFNDEEIVLWSDGTWDTLPYKFQSIDSNHNGFPDNEENDTVFKKILETHSDIEEKLDQQNVN